MAEPSPTMIQAQVVWGNVDSLPVLAANQFLVQLTLIDQEDPVGDVVLTLGFVPPPVLLGTPEQQQEALAARGPLTINPVARFIIPAGKAAELAQVMQDLFKRRDDERRQP